MKNVRPSSKTRRIDKPLIPPSITPRRSELGLVLVPAEIYAINGVHGLEGRKSDMPPMVARLAAYLSFWADHFRNPVISKSVRTIALELGVDVRSVRDAIKALRADRWIELGRDLVKGAMRQVIYVCWRLNDFPESVSSEPIAVQEARIARREARAEGPGAEDADGPGPSLFYPEAEGNFRKEISVDRGSSEWKTSVSVPADENANTAPPRGEGDAPTAGPTDLAEPTPPPAPPTPDATPDRAAAATDPPSVAECHAILAESLHLRKWPVTVGKYLHALVDQGAELPPAWQGVKLPPRLPDVTPDRVRPTRALGAPPPSAGKPTDRLESLIRGLGRASTEAEIRAVAWAFVDEWDDGKSLGFYLVLAREIATGRVCPSKVVTRLKAARSANKPKEDKPRMFTRWVGDIRPKLGA